MGESVPVSSQGSVRGQSTDVDIYTRKVDASREGKTGQKGEVVVDQVLDTGGVPRKALEGVFIAEPLVIDEIPLPNDGTEGIVPRATDETGRGGLCGVKVLG